MSLSERPTLTVAETAELLGISRWLVQQAVREGALPSLRLGRRILIPRARLQAWLEGVAAPTQVGGLHDDAQRRAAASVASVVPRAHAM